MKPPERRATKKVFKGKIAVGGDAPISVQSMTKTKTENTEATGQQIKSLMAAGCDIVRVAVPTMEAAEAIASYKEAFDIPIIADIHFNYRLALRSVDAGADGMRINPGNIGGPDRVMAIAEASGKKGIPIRIGVNAGSVKKDLLEKYGHSARALVESAKGSLRLLEETGFKEIVISLKSSDAWTTIEAYRLMARECDYPFHLGVTEAGVPRVGAVRSAVGIGTLLAEGIGDTIRVSLTGDPVDEVLIGFEILKALGLRKRGPSLVSCPTCGRCKVDILSLAEQVQEALLGMDQEIRVAVMGCEVNGPGEARAADVGIAGGGGYLVIFRGGKPLRRVREDEAVQGLMDEIENFLAENIAVTKDDS
ncbi:flavodoxin-dependent (E)-4-hydroxy-3-methylbut-2-enyl-diphosphate synthase [Acidobacteriota bacterium]